MPPTPSPIPDRVQRVELGDRAYDALIGAGLMQRLGTLARAAVGQSPSNAMLVADKGLPATLIREASESLRTHGFAVSLCSIEATESNKSLQSAEQVCVAMANDRLERRDPVIAIGGGIIGDLAGFAASMYRRGVPIIQCPTTLLSMVDAAVGGKTGANLRVSNSDGTPTLLKNLVGAFHQPALVLADIQTLDTLPERHFRSGLAECLKHAMLALDVERSGEHPTDLFTFTVISIAGILQKSHSLLAALVARNIAIKARVVASDERELSTDPTGGRAILNLGHTFAHAIETLPDLSPTGSPADAPLHHGEAVALGLIAAAHAATELGILPAADAKRVQQAVGALGLPTRVQSLPSSDALIARMRHDKKVVGGRLRLILPCRLGAVRSHFDPPIRVVEAGWDSIRA